MLRKSFLLTFVLLVSAGILGVFLFGNTVTAANETYDVNVSPSSVKAGGNVTVTVSAGPKDGAGCVYFEGQTANSACYASNNNPAPYDFDLDSQGAGSISVKVGTQTGSFKLFTVVSADGRNFNGAVKESTVTITSGTPSGSTSATECATFITTNPPQIKEGSSGQAVRCAQALLNEKMDAGLSIDGSFDRQMAIAVWDFQNGDYPGGTKLNCQDAIIGPETWGALLGRVINQQTQCNKIEDPGDPKDPDDKNPSSGLDCESQGLKEKNGLCLPDNPNSGGKGLVSCDSLGSCLNKIIRFLLTIAAVIAVLFIIIGGLQYVTSAGNESRAESGKKTLTYAIIGLAVIILAYTIVTIINSALTRDSLF